VSAADTFVVASNGVVPDAELVRRVRAGDDAAFEELFRRYEGRIRAFVAGRVGDRGRAEDVTQEAFLSALRRLRTTDAEIAFKPWLFEIALNATIDLHRRTSRAEEVSVDHGELLRPSDRRRLVGVAAPETEALTRERLEHLRGAFDVLNETHHRLLVMRELEGRSYRDIGEQLKLSHSAVESALFRARRRLESEYEALAAGRRCLSVLDDIVSIAEGAEARGPRRRLARHARRCSSCRVRAREMGVEPLPRFAGLRSRVGALLPIPWLLRRRPGSTARGDSSPAGHTASLLSGPASQACSSLAEGALALVTAAALAGAGSAALDRAGPRPVPGGAPVHEVGAGGAEPGGANTHRRADGDKLAPRSNRRRAPGAAERPALDPSGGGEAPRADREERDSGSRRPRRAPRRLPTVPQLPRPGGLAVPKVPDPPALPERPVALPQSNPVTEQPKAEADLGAAKAVLDAVRSHAGAG
jgi:RNA polymerase sigma factor (sigma-70 family)